MIRRPPRSTLFPYTTALPICQGASDGLLADQEHRVVPQSALPLKVVELRVPVLLVDREIDPDRKSTRLNSSHANISYAVFCLKKKKKIYISLDTQLLSSRTMP